MNQIYQLEQALVTLKTKEQNAVLAIEEYFIAIKTASNLKDKINEQYQERIKSNVEITLTKEIV